MSKIGPALPTGLSGGSTAAPAQRAAVAAMNAKPATIRDKVNKELKQTRCMRKAAGILSFYSNFIQISFCLANLKNILFFLTKRY